MPHDGDLGQPVVDGETWQMNWNRRTDTQIFDLMIFDPAVKEPGQSEENQFVRPPGPADRCIQIQVLMLSKPFVHGLVFLHAVHDDLLCNLSLDFLA